MRTALIVALLLFAGFLISLPFRNYPLGRSYPILPVIFTTEALAAALTATLLFSQAAVIRSRSLIALATGYLFSAFIVIPEALTYAHAFSEKGLLSAGLSTSTWLYLFWHTGFPIAVMTYAGLKTTDATRPVRQEYVGRTIVVCITGTAAFVALLTILAIVGEPWLPQQMTDPFTWAWPSASLFAAVPLALFVGALMTLLIQERSVLDLWLALVLWFWLIETALGLLTTGRFTLGWYVSVVTSVSSEAVILALLLSESNRLYARLARSNAELRRERDNKLMTLDAVTASMSHELSQPLGAILRNSDVALEVLGEAEPDLEELRLLTSDVNFAAGRSRDVLKNIRVLFGKATEQHEQVDLNETTRGALRTARRELEEHGVDIRTNLASVLPPVSGRASQLQEVILNLLHNAVEAMDTVKDENRVLELRTGHDGGRALIVEVQDSGPGIDPGAQERIFEPFITTKPHGMGLGLAICRVIVERHGGQLSALPANPRGAIFRISLPPSC